MAFCASFGFLASLSIPMLDILMLDILRVRPDVTINQLRPVNGSFGSSSYPAIRTGSRTSMRETNHVM